MEFSKTKKGEGSRVIGSLEWAGESFDVVSGGYGKGELPNGNYTIKVRYAAEGNKNNMASGFIDSKTGKGWFLPLEPKFSTTRSGFGIHPDGNKPGTKGCVGLQGDDANKFWKKWLNTSISLRPTELKVSSSISE